MTRTDIHRPAAIVPDDYTFVAHECVKVDGLEAAAFILRERERLQAHREATGATWSDHEHGGNCGICGSVNAIYTLIFHHRPSNTYVRVGTDCAEKLDRGGDFGASAFRAAILDARDAQAGKRKAEALLGDAGLTAAWALYTAGWVEGQHNDDRIILELVTKLVRWGSLSEKQWAFLGRLVESIPLRAQKAAEREAEREAAAPCPTGRIEIEGVVLSTKVVESDFGRTLKMLVKHADGWKVWGTIPVSLSVKVGEPVKIRATITPSKDDPKFGFYSRPIALEVA